MRFAQGSVNSSENAMNRFSKVIVTVLFAALSFMAVFVASSERAAAEPPDPCFHDGFDGF